MTQAKRLLGCSFSGYARVTLGMTKYFPKKMKILHYYFVCLGVMYSGEYDDCDVTLRQ